MRTNRRGALAVAVLLSIACISLCGCAVIVARLNPFGGEPESLEEQTVQGEGGAKILLVDVSKVISDEPRDEAFGLRRHESAVARLVEQLRRAAKDDEVRAVVVRINSPGGTVTASDILYHEIRRFAEQKQVPVVAQLMDVAASGGYYVALAADEIVAHPTTVTGSIGVVMFGLNFAGLLDKIGVADQTLKAGAHKDIGSPLRQMTPEERQILQAILDQMRQRFVELVRERRPQARPELLAEATDGRVLSAEQALRSGLVDDIGYLEDSLSIARRRAGIEQARVIMYRRPSEYAENIYSDTHIGAPQVNLIHFDLDSLGFRGQEFMYLWLPGGL